MCIWVKLQRQVTPNYACSRNTDASSCLSHTVRAMPLPSTWCCFCEWCAVLPCKQSCDRTLGWWRHLTLKRTRWRAGPIRGQQLQSELAAAWCNSTASEHPAKCTQRSPENLKTAINHNIFNLDKNSMLSVLGKIGWAPGYFGWNESSRMAFVYYYIMND